MAQTIFGTEVPANLNNNDSPDQYTLGTRFQPLVDGQVTHVEWYFPASSPTQPVQAGIYRNSDSLLLESVTFPGGLSGGRHQVALPSPVDVLTGVEYTVALWTSDFYVSTGGYFSTDKTSGDLYCPVVAGRFLVGPSLAFPTSNFGNANYWPDVVFQPGGAPAEGTAAIGLGLAVAATGGADAEATSATGLNLAVSASGRARAGGVVALSLGLAPAGTGERASAGGAALGLGLAPAASGLRDASGAVTLGLRYAVAAVGSNGQSGRPVEPWPFGQVTGSSYPWTPRPVRSFEEVEP